MSDHAGRDTVSSLKTGLNAVLTPEESVLVLIDHQPFQFANLNSHEPTMIVNTSSARPRPRKPSVCL